MPRLRRVDCSGPGIRRRRHGRGFGYVDADGVRVDEPEVLARIAELAIPPAWEDVWICPYPHGHLQATGTDVAGRKQYRYHDAWRTRRDAEKFDDMVAFAHALPDLRARVRADLGDCKALDRACVLAAAVRLLEIGFFRIGSEEYAVENASYGLATMRKEHVRIEDGGLMVFDYPAKSGQRRHQGIADEQLARIVGALQRRRGGGPELLAYKAGRALARRALGGHQRVPQGRRRAATSRRRTSGPGTRPRSPRWRSPSPARRRPRRRRASGRSTARSRRWPATSATRPRSAAPPTSTRACSTPSTPG